MNDKLDPNSNLPVPAEIVPEVERQVADQLPELFQKLPESVKKETVRKVSVAAMKVSVSSWESDGYPPPAILEEYEKFSPGFSQNVVRMAEDELKHNQIMEIKVAQYFSRGQWMGFILALVAVAGSIWLISIGKEITGGILGGAVVLPLVTMFIRGQLSIGKTSAANHPQPASQKTKSTSRKRKNQK